MFSKFERLESRRMLASAPPPVDWVIQGTSAADVITITQSGNTVTVNNNGIVTTHPAVGYYVPGPSPYQQIGVVGLRKIIVHGYSSNDQIIADDTVQVPMELYGGYGRDTLKGGAKNDLLKGQLHTHDPMSIIEYFGDEMHGNSGDDTLIAQEYGASTLHGNDGDDDIQGSDYNDVITGGRGNDSIMGLEGNDNIVAGPQLIMAGNGQDRDTVDSAEGRDTVYGGVGNDVLVTGDWSDSVVGGVGDDSMHTGDGDDTVIGESGKDSIYLGEGWDRASGGDGDDKIYGHSGSDTLFGDAGDDFVQGGSSGDSMSGGDGYDEISYADNSAGVTANLQGGSGMGSRFENDIIVGDFEQIEGGFGNDTLTGNSAANKMYGWWGEDQIDGRGGDDSIYGERGNDSLFGGAGSDKLYGNEDDDNLSGGREADSLFGGTGNDTLVSVGGTVSDKSWGEDGTDSFWIDNNSNEWFDGTPAEHNDGRVHKISSFVNSPSMELDGQDLSDPAIGNEAPFYTNFTGRPLFATQGPTIDDVDQGLSGDCYFMAGLAAVAQKGPGWIHERVCDLGDGTYAVMFNGNYIRVDNELPTTTPNGSSPTYAGFGLEGSMWVAIMEKAFALVRSSAKSYASLDSGTRNEPFDLLGISNEDFWDEDNDDLLQGIRNALVSGDAVTASTHPGTFTDGMIVVPSHVYTVVSVNLNAQTVYVRNPWKSDAGNNANSWSDGNNDGYVTLSMAQFRGQCYGATIANI